MARSTSDSPIGDHDFRPPAECPAASNTDSTEAARSQSPLLRQRVHFMAMSLDGDENRMTAVATRRPSLFERLRVVLQQAAPAARRRECGAQGDGRVAVALEMAVFEGDLGRIRAFCLEAHLDLGEQRGIEVPLRVDLPGEHETGWRSPDKHAAPV